MATSGSEPRPALHLRRGSCCHRWLRASVRRGTSGFAATGHEPANEPHALAAALQVCARLVRLRNAVQKADGRAERILQVPPAASTAAQKGAKGRPSRHAQGIRVCPPARHVPWQSIDRPVTAAGDVVRRVCLLGDERHQRREHRLAAPRAPAAGGPSPPEQEDGRAGQDLPGLLASILPGEQPLHDRYTTVA